MRMADDWYKITICFLSVLFLLNLAMPLGKPMWISVVIIIVFYVFSIQFFLYQWKQIKMMMKILPFENKHERGIHDLHWKLWCYNCDKHLKDREKES